MYICKGDIVKWLGDEIQWDNSCERDICLNIYPSPFIFTYIQNITIADRTPCIYIGKGGC